MDSSVKTVSVPALLLREAPAFVVSFLIGGGVQPRVLRRGGGQ